MQRIIKSTLIILSLIFISSCVDEDELFELDDFEVGALPNLQRTSNDLGFINLLDLTGSNLEFSVGFTIDRSQSDDGGFTDQGDGRELESTEFSSVESVQLEISFQGAANGNAVESASLTTITSWPATVNFLGVDDLVEALPSLSSRDDIELGDVFTFVCGVTLQDGRVLPAFVTDPAGNKTPNYSINYSGTLNNPGYDFGVTYVVTCPSNLAGNYTSTVLSSNIPLTNFRTPQPVTVTGANGTYTLSDGSADYFGPDFPLGLAFNELCEQITITPGSTNFPTLVIWDLNSSSYDPDTGIILFDLIYNPASCCGLPGIQYVLELTPN